MNISIIEKIKEEYINGITFLKLRTCCHNYHFLEIFYSKKPSNTLFSLGFAFYEKDDSIFVIHASLFYRDFWIVFLGISFD